jgi:SOS-response transcriptional repressor LexA
MDVHQTRRANLRWLIENECEGVAANLARTLGIQATQLSRIFSENARHRRNIGARLARAIEQATSKRRGWMDEPHVAPEAFSPGTSKTDQGNAVVLTPFGDRMVPVLDYVQASEWMASAKPYPIMERTEILWTRLPQLSERAFALVVEGESMIDEFYPGDIVIVDPDVAPRPGDYVVAKTASEDALTFRKYRPRGMDRAGKPVVELAPLKDDYPATVIDSTSPGLIIGTMVEHRKYRRTARLSVPDHLPAQRGKA